MILLSNFAFDFNLRRFTMGLRAQAAAYTQRRGVARWRKGGDPEDCVADMRTAAAGFIALGLADATGGGGPGCDGSGGGGGGMGSGGSGGGGNGGGGGGGGNGGGGSGGGNGGGDGGGNWGGGGGGSGGGNGGGGSGGCVPRPEGWIAGGESTAAVSMEAARRMIGGMEGLESVNYYLGVSLAAAGYVTGAVESLQAAAAAGQGHPAGWLLRTSTRPTLLNLLLRFSGSVWAFTLKVKSCSHLSSSACCE